MRTLLSWLNGLVWVFMTMTWTIRVAARESVKIAPKYIDHILTKYLTIRSHFWVEVWYRWLAAYYVAGLIAFPVLCYCLDNWWLLLGIIPYYFLYVLQVLVVQVDV